MQAETIKQMETTTLQQKHNGIDAQQIVLDTDPEETLPEPEQHDNDSHCKQTNKQFICRALSWYISPIACNISHSLLCLIYHCINFVFALAFVIFDATTIGTSLGLTAVCCIGVPLLWVTFEIILILSRIDLGTVYYMVEEKSVIDESRRHLLTLSLYFQDFPLCCCWNSDSGSMLNIMLRRLKYLFTSCDLCGYIAYQVFIKPWSSIAWGIVVIVCVNAAIIGLPVWYLADNTMFKQNKIAFGYSRDCDYPNNGGVFCDNDPIWIVNSFARTLFWALLALFILPFTVRISNYLAYLNKITIYYVYTYYYTKDESLVQDKTSLLTNERARINSV